MLAIPTGVQLKVLNNSQQRIYKTQRRCLSKTLFPQTLKNGECMQREWLHYSPSTGNVYCFICHLFQEGTRSSAFIDSGFSDWKHANTRVEEHEVSCSHQNVVLTWIAHTQINGIDVALNELFGPPNNGNYLTYLNYLSYLSSTICEKFVVLMGQRVPAEIILQVQKAKYFSIVVDSTPDVSHTDQLTFVICYVSQEGQIYERFPKSTPHGFFCVIQSLFNFCSASPRNWKLIKDGLDPNENKRVETSLKRRRALIEEEMEGMGGMEEDLPDEELLENDLEEPQPSTSNGR
ncbi:ZMYM5 protein, partial [Polyodon spathula]|nr:ZMYM5 protein [Polyodon spathula]